MQPNRIDKQSIEDATREAESRALDFNPRERAALIRRMIVLIPRAIAVGMTDRDIGLQDGFKQASPFEPELAVNPEYKEIRAFADAYPELFKKIVGQQDLTPIRTMLAMLDKIAEGQISTHQASILVGQKLVDRYVKPQLRGHEKGGRGH